MVLPQPSYKHLGALKNPLAVSLTSLWRVVHFHPFLLELLVHRWLWSFSGMLLFLNVKKEIKCEKEPGFRSMDMLFSYMNSLLLIFLPNLFLNNHANWSWINIENSSSPAMIGFVGHSLLLRAIYPYINVLS